MFRYLSGLPRGSRTWRLAGYVYFTFICYVSIGLPLAVLPPFVHLRMGYSAVLAGLAISIQYIATLLSRPWAGRISDHMGAKVSVMWGMACCTASGALLVGAAALHERALAELCRSDREPPGARRGREPGFDRRDAVGHHQRRPGTHRKGDRAERHQHLWRHGAGCAAGRGAGSAVGPGFDRVLTILIGAVSFVMAWRKAPVAVEPGEHMPFAHVLGRVAPHGMGLALGGVSYSVLATFVTLFYVSRHWNGAALCLTAFGIGVHRGRACCSLKPSAALADTRWPIASLVD